MIPLSQLLARFIGLKNNEKAQKELISEKKTKIIGIPIKHNQISFSKNILFIKTQPIIKSEITLKKEEILRRIQTLQGLSNISNIQ